MSERAAHQARPTGASAAQLRQRVVEAGSSMHRSRVDLIRALVAYERTGDWALTGAVTCAHWAATQLGVAVSTVRDWLRVGRALAELPEVDAAFESGRLSYCKTRALIPVVDDHPDRQLELVDLVADATTEETGRVLARWSDQFEDQDERDARHREATHMSLRVLPDGSGHATIRLPPIEFGRLQAAVDQRLMRGDLADRSAWAVPPGVTAKGPEAGSVAPGADDGGPDERARPSLGCQRALALVDLATNGGADVVTEVLVHVRSDGCSLHDGTPISDNAVAGLLDQSFIRALIHDAEGRPIDASGRRRPTKRQQRVVDERFPRCVDCGTTELITYDHEPPYSVTWATRVDELFPRCVQCHEKKTQAQAQAKAKAEATARSRSGAAGKAPATDCQMSTRQRGMESMRPVESRGLAASGSGEDGGEVDPRP